MFLVELIASSFFYLISKQARLDAAVSALLFKLYRAYSISFKTLNVSKLQRASAQTIVVCISLASSLAYRGLARWKQFKK